MCRSRTEIVACRPYCLSVWLEGFRLLTLSRTMGHHECRFHVRLKVGIVTLHSHQIIAMHIIHVHGHIHFASGHAVAKVILYNDLILFSRNETVQYGSFERIGVTLLHRVDFDDLLGADPLHLDQRLVHVRVLVVGHLKFEIHLVIEIGARNWGDNRAIGIDAKGDFFHRCKLATFGNPVTIVDNNFIVSKSPSTANSIAIDVRNVKDVISRQGVLYDFGIRVSWRVDGAHILFGQNVSGYVTILEVAEFPGGFLRIIVMFDSDHDGIISPHDNCLVGRSSHSLFGSTGGSDCRNQSKAADPRKFHGDGWFGIFLFCCCCCCCSVIGA
mmetsp:Transcript_11739/g.22518  ORF Transcript_11739/g.22518 Transcript_11739/m.22518 type:complete len:328 (-) Transcript_11739:291-1274(-)